MTLRALNNVPARAPYDSSVSVIDPLVRQARECFREQAAAVAALESRVDQSFSMAVRVLEAVAGHVVITGIGKSGLIGKKIAATLASTGTPSFFVHAAEATHGDLGMITEHDAVMLLSYSGETEEVVRLLPHLQARNVPMIALCGRRDSTLARGVDVFLDVAVDREICPNNVAPTNSTLATLAMGDALAMCLSRLRRFQAEDFARLHPGGSLGRRLLHTVRDAMIDAPLPVVSTSATARDCMLALTGSRVHAILVMEDDVLRGMVTGSEVRQVLANGGSLEVPVAEIMNRNPSLIAPNVPIDEAELKMRREGVDVMLVVEPSGLVRGVMVHMGNE